MGRLRRPFGFLRAFGFLSTRTAACHEPQIAVGSLLATWAAALPDDPSRLLEASGLTGSQSVLHFWVPQLATPPVSRYYPGLGRGRLAVGAPPLGGQVWHWFGLPFGVAVAVADLLSALGRNYPMGRIRLAKGASSKIDSVVTGHGTQPFVSSLGAVRGVRPTSECWGSLVCLGSLELHGWSSPLADIY
mgnify:FL=1